MRHAILISCLILIVGRNWAEPAKPYPHYALYENVRTLWQKGDDKKFQVLLGKRVKINLKVLSGRYGRKSYPKEKAVGILKWYFSKVKVLELKYSPKKMTKTRGVAVYRYKVISSGVEYSNRIYFYLRQEKVKGKVVWVIAEIREIGSKRD